VRIRRLPELPDWVRLVVTTRPEELRDFERVERMVIGDDPASPYCEQHRRDLFMYLCDRLRKRGLPQEETEDGARLLVDRSEGMWLYTAKMFAAPPDGLPDPVTRADLEQAPKGMAQWCVGRPRSYDAIHENV
jgi:hypothetical protein